MAATENTGIIKEGWLYKRGVYIKNWRPRYFRLLDNGNLLGYKGGCPDDGGKEDPLNAFPIANCKVKTEKDKKTQFTIIFLDQTNFIERLFKAESAKERDEWTTAVNQLASEVQAQRQMRSLGGLPSSTNSLATESPTSAAGSDVPFGSGTTIGLDDFEIISVLGKGTFGKVVLARQKGETELVAIKLLKKEVIMEKDEVDHTLNENRVLRRIKHPFLTDLKYSFQTVDRLCFVLEFVNGGELFYHLTRERIFEAPRVRFYAAEILLGLGYLHDQGIIYRDLKLENLLLDSEGHIKITDFGLCKENIKQGDTTATFCGTPEYLAPEVLEDNDYTRAVDWWGLGVVVYEMMCGQLPFMNQDHEVLFDLILNGEVTYPKHVTVVPHCVNLLTGLLNKHPHERLGGGSSDHAEITSHPFFSSINFDDLYHKRILPPFKPAVKDASDISNFEIEFTRESTELSPTNMTGLDALGKFDDFNYIPA